MHAVRIWLIAARPKTLIAGASPIVMGMTLALSDGVFNPIVFLLTLLTALGIQIATNFVNDYFDFLKGADCLQRKGPLRVMQAGLVSSRKMKCAISIVFSLTFILGCTLIYQGGLSIACILLVSLLLAYGYTAGPYPLAYLGLGDLFVLLFFGPIAVLCTYYLQTHHFSKEAFIVGISPGCLSTAILIANNVRDIEEDRKAHKKTLPVRFGKFFGKIQYCSFIFCSLIPLLFFYRTHPFSSLAFLILIPAFPLLRAMLLEKDGDAATLNQIFLHTGKLLWLFTFLFCLGWML